MLSTERRRPPRASPSSRGSAISTSRGSRLPTSSTASRWTSTATATPASTTCASTCWRVASTVGLICIEIFGQRSARAREYAVNLGIALQLTNILRDVGGDAALGRIYLPQDDLRRFGCSVDDLKRGQGRRPASATCWRSKPQRARRYYDQAARTLRAASTPGRWSRPRSWAASTGRRSTASSGPGTTCSRQRIRVPRARRVAIAARAPGCARGSDVMSRPDVVVVGAGFAGLSAAVRLVAGRRARARGRGATPARRPRDRVCGPAVRRDRRQRAARAVRLLSRDLCVSSRHRRVRRREPRRAAGYRDRRPPRHAQPTGDAAVAAAAAPGGRPVAGLRSACATAPPRCAWDWCCGGCRGATAARRGPGWRDRTAEAWLVECGQTPRLRELLWEPLVVAALNQSPATAAAAPFARVLARMFNGSRSDAAIGLPRVPLDALYAEPARRWLEARGSSAAVRCRRDAGRRGGPGGGREPS